MALDIVKNLETVQLNLEIRISYDVLCDFIGNGDDGSPIIIDSGNKEFMKLEKQGLVTKRRGETVST